MRMNPSLWNLPCRQAGINQDGYFHADSTCQPYGTAKQVWSLKTNKINQFKAIIIEDEDIIAKVILYKIKFVAPDIDVVTILPSL